MNRVWLKDSITVCDWVNANNVKVISVVYVDNGYVVFYELQ